MAQVPMEIADIVSDNLHTALSNALSTIDYYFGPLRVLVAQAPDWFSWLLVGILVLVGLWLVWQGLARGSKLIRPEALELDIDNPEHLCGRQEDLQDLIAAVAFRPLVFLEGESGVGKSALIRAGLIPAIQKANSHLKLIPIYINCYDKDWDQGLRAGLLSAIWNGLNTILRSKLNVNSQEMLRRRLLDEQGTRGIFHRLHNELNQRFLLIFDQFDDYIAINRQRFLHGGRWITAKELVAQNEFWCGVHSELEHRTLHCIFITCRGWSTALDAVRFRAPVQRELNSVEADAVAALLSRLTTNIPADTDSVDTRPSQIIAHPNAGWIALKDLLIQDLTNQGRILPIQARVVFQSLAILPELSIGAYEDAGGIEGIEALAMQNAVATAAKAAGVHDAQVQDALMTLVDNTASMLPKAWIASELAIFAAAKLDANRGLHMLAALVRTGIVKPVAITPNTTENHNWSLYHDYLANLVLKMQRHSGKWQRLLQARYHTFYAVEGLRAKWLSLLAPGEQLHLLLESLRGKVNWEGYRFFGMLSTIRVLPLILTCMLVLVGTHQILDWQAYNIADSILFRLRNAQGVGESLEGDALRQFWVLAAAGPRLKLAFIDRLLADTTAQSSLIKHLDVVTQSIFGLDPGSVRKKRALHLIISVINRNASIARQQVLPYPALLAESIYATDPENLRNFSDAIAKSLDAAMVRSDDESLIALGAALGHIEKQLPVQQARFGAERLVEAMRSSNDGWQLLQLGQAINGLKSYLTPSQTQLAAERLVAVMHGTSNRGLLAELGQILADFGTNVPHLQAEIAAKRLVDVMGASTDRDQMNRLAIALDNLTTHLPQVQAVVERIAEVMRASRDREQLANLEEILEHFAARLSNPQTIAEKLVLGLEESHDQDQRSIFGQCLVQLGKRLTISQIKSVADYLTSVITNLRNPDQLAELGYSLGQLINIPKNDASKIFESNIQISTSQLAKSVNELTVPRHLAELGKALAAFGSYLPQAQAESSANRLVEAMKLSTAPRQIIRLGQALSSFGDHLPKNAAQLGAERLVDLIEITNDSEQINPLGDVLDSLGTRLPQIKPIIERLVVTMGATTDVDRLTALNQTLKQLFASLPQSQSMAIVEQIIGTMATATNQDTLAALGHALGTFFTSQSSIATTSTVYNTPFTKQARSAADSLISAMQVSTDWERVAALGQALGIIIYSNNLTNYDAMIAAQAEADRLVAAMRASTIPSQLAALGRVLGELGPRLPEAQAQAGAERLIAIMRTSTTSPQLTELIEALSGLNTRLPQPQAQAVAEHVVEAMRASSDEEQVLQLGRVFKILGDRLSPAQIQAGADRLAEIMRVFSDNQRLINIKEILGSLGTRLPPNIAKTAAERLVAAMRISSDWEQLTALNQAIISLFIPNNTYIEAAVAPQIQAGAERLVDTLQEDTGQSQPKLIDATFQGLGTNLPLPQLKILAERIIKSMQTSNDWRQLIVLGAALKSIGERLPMESALAGAECLLNAMENTTSAEAFVQMAKVLNILPLTPNSNLISVTTNLLKAPLAVGVTKTQILAILSKLAGTPFATSEDFIAWNRLNLSLDLSQPPRSPFQ